MDRISESEVILFNPRNPLRRPFKVQPSVDASIAALCIPQHVRIQLDLQELGRREVKVANGKKEVVSYVGPVEVFGPGLGHRSFFKFPHDNASGCRTGALVIGDRVHLPAVPVEDWDLLVSFWGWSGDINWAGAMGVADVLREGERVLLELRQGIHSLYVLGLGTKGYRHQFGFPSWLDATHDEGLWSGRWWRRHFAEGATVYYTNTRIIFSGDSEGRCKRDWRRFFYVTYPQVRCIRMLPRCLHCGFLDSRLFPFMALANWLSGKIDLSVYWCPGTYQTNEFTITCNSRQEARETLQRLQTQLLNVPFVFRTESPLYTLVRRMYNIRRRTGET